MWRRERSISGAHESADSEAPTTAMDLGAKIARTPRALAGFTEPRVAPLDRLLQTLIERDAPELLAFRQIGGLDQGVDLYVRVDRLPEPLLLPHPIDRALLHGDREGIVLGDLLRQGQGRCVQLAGGNNPVDQTDTQGLRGVDAVLAGEQQLLRLSGAQDPWHDHGDDSGAETDLGLTEPGVVRTHAQIADHHEVA